MVRIASAMPMTGLPFLLVSLLLAVLPLWALPADTTPKEPPPKPDDANAGPIRRFNLMVGAKTVWSDCSPMPDSLVINGTTPGPVLRVRAGERVIVNVTNAHPTLPTTMHWHGLSMRLNAVSDGTPMVSQWPIDPYNWFEYDIRLPRDEHGTYFLHAHVGLQSMTAYAALIIEDALPQDDKDAKGKPDITWGDEDLQQLNGRSSPGAPYAYDEDRVLALSDYWGYTTQSDILSGLRADPFVWPGAARSLLLNGHQRGKCNETAIQPLKLACPAALPGDPKQPLCDFAEIRVSYGKTYRLRLIGAQSMMLTAIGILNHTIAQGNRLELIEADGTYLKAFPTDYLEMAPGQRYSWLFKAKTKEEVDKDKQNGLYWIRMESRWRTGPAGWAKLVYEDDAGAPDDAKKQDPPKPTGPADPPVVKDGTNLLPPEKAGWIYASLAPLENDPEQCPPDDKVTRVMVIEAQQHRPAKNATTTKAVQWWENSNTYFEETATPTPYLVSLYTGAKPAPSVQRALDPSSAFNDPAKFNFTVKSPEELELARKHRFAQQYDDVTDVYIAQPDEVIDIVIVNRPSAMSNNTEVHPWHMHSRKSCTRTIQAGTFSFAGYEKALAARDHGEFANPIPRDTTVVYPSPGAAYLNQTIDDPDYHDGGWSVIRYNVSRDNAGIFLLHCHITPHLAMGMAVVFGVDVDDLINNELKDLYGVQPDGSIQGLSGSYLKPHQNVSAVIQGFPGGG